MIQNKVLVKAGKFKGGTLPYVNYVGQIKPADMPKIVWWGAFGNDGTGDGSFSSPFLTFAAAIGAFDTTTHKWVLNTDLTVYGDSDAAPYIDDPANRVYLDPTKADDSGDGLTAVTAKKTYAAAKTVLGSSGRAVIHCIGTFTFTDLIDAPIQGEVGEVLTFDAAAQMPAALTPVSPAYFAGLPSNSFFLSMLETSTGTILAFGGDNTYRLIIRSTDGGQSFTQVTGHPWVTATDFATCGAEGDGVIVACCDSDKKVLRSIDDGLTWTEHDMGAMVLVKRTYAIVWTGSLFVAAGTYCRTSPDGITWTNRPWVTTSNVYIRKALATNGAGLVLAAAFDGSTESLEISTDGGLTWADYSSDISGFGSPYFIGYRSGIFTMFCEDNSDGYFYTNSNPTSTPWGTFGTQKNMTGNQSASLQLGYSAVQGGYILAPRSVTVSDTLEVWDGATLAPFTSFGAFDRNKGTLIITRDGIEILLILSWDSTLTKISRLSFAETNIRASVTNLQADAGRKIQSEIGVSYVNVTAEPTTGIAMDTVDDTQIKRSRIVSADDKAISHIGNKIKLKRCIVKGSAASDLRATAAAVNDVEILQNVIAGGVTLDNVGGADKETIQDNIIEGNFTASELVTVKSNIRGTVVNSTSQSVISTIPPIFVDTTDYFLSRIALGQTVDSPLISRSALSSFVYNSETFKDDFGPYRAFTALVQTVYKRAFALPRFSGNALGEDVENVSALLKSIRGKPDVSNRPQGRLEIISWSSKSVNSEVREFVAYMEKLSNLEVYLDYDFDGRAPDTVTVNGAHSAGTFEINIQPQDIPVGTIISLFSKSQLVTQRYPRAGAATKLILDDVLSGGLSNGQVVPITYIQGAGVFVYVPNRPRKNLRIFSRKRDAYSGMSYTFVRKAE